MDDASYLWCHTGDPSWSIRAFNVDDVERFFKSTIENRYLFAATTNNIFHIS